MLKRNQLYVSLFASSLVLLGASVANAEENLTSTASVTVQNAFDLTETTPLSFGTIRATYVVSSGDATIRMRPDGSISATNPGDGESAVATLVPGQPAEFAIANASNFTEMTITLPADGDVFLTNSAAPSTAARFVLNSFTMADATTPATLLSGADAAVETDNLGVASFLVGATLSTSASDAGDPDTTPYVDGAYEGNFTITVEY